MYKDNLLTTKAIILENMNNQHIIDYTSKSEMFCHVSKMVVQYQEER